MNRRPPKGGRESGAGGAGHPSLHNDNRDAGKEDFVYGARC